MLHPPITYLTQTITDHKPDEGRFGDCFRTAVACLLSRTSPCDIPHFYNSTVEVAAEVETCIDCYLRDHHRIGRIRVCFDGGLGVEGVLAIAAKDWPDFNYLLSGESPRGHNHVVVCYRDQLIHDPHPSRAGLVGPCPGEDDTYFLVEFLLKL